MSSGDGVRAHLGMVSGSASLVDTISGAWVVGRGVRDGAEDLQIGVVGVESVSVSMSVGASGVLLLGGGVMRSRIVTFFFLFLGLDMLRGEGLVAFGVWMARLSIWESSSSFMS